MHVDAAFDTLPRAPIREEHDRPRGVAEGQLADAERRAARVDLAFRVHDEVEDRRPRDRASLLARVRGLRATEPGELALEGRHPRCACAPEAGVDRPLG